MRRGSKEQRHLLRPAWRSDGRRAAKVRNAVEEAAPKAALPATASLRRLSRRSSEVGFADDSGTFHLSVAGRVVHHRVMLGAAVVPERHAVGLPAEAHLAFGHRGLADQVVQQLASTGREVLTDVSFMNLMTRRLGVPPSRATGGSLQPGIAAWRGTFWGRLEPWSGAAANQGCARWTTSLGWALTQKG